jgi:hypothetical protein
VNKNNIIAKIKNNIGNPKDRFFLISPGHAKKVIYRQSGHAPSKLFAIPSIERISYTTTTRHIQTLGALNTTFSFLKSGYNSKSQFTVQTHGLSTVVSLTHAEQP